MKPQSYQRNKSMTKKEKEQVQPIRINEENIKLGIRYVNEYNCHSLNPSIKLIRVCKRENKVIVFK